MSAKVSEAAASLRRRYYSIDQGVKAGIGAAACSVVIFVFLLLAM
jgi:hypothetical protein